MNKTVKTVALLSILGLTATSCQKENLVESYNPTATETVALHGAGQYGMLSRV